MLLSAEVGLIRVLYKGPLSPFTGYGNDGIGMVMAMLKRRWDVSVLPTGLIPPIPHEIAVLLSRPIVPPFDLLINHVDPYALYLGEGEGQSARVRLAWTMWERTFIEDTVTETQMSFDSRMQQFSAVASYDDVSYEAMSGVLPASKPHFVQQGGFRPEDWPLAKSRDWSGTFRFCMAGMLHDRKNPFAAVQAFDELKQEHGDSFDAQLLLKTNSRALHPSMEERYEGLKVIEANWSHEQMLEFYGACHVLLSPSRGEGKNMPALEFMSTGGTVIATAWGGHMQWMHSSYAYPLEYELESVSGESRAKQARASVKHLKHLMWHCYNNRAEAREKGTLAASVIPKMCSWETVLDRLVGKLKEVLGDRGEDLYRASMYTVPEQAVGEAVAGRRA